MNAKELSRRRRFDRALMVRRLAFVDAAKLIPRNDVRSEEDVRGGGPPGHFYVSVHFTRVVARFLQVFVL